jgi:glycosyltransferase involved in cell wall biosynthesis
MRIGVNCLGLSDTIGGVKSYFYNLFGELIKRDDTHEYVFFYSEGNADLLDKLQSGAWRENAVEVSNALDIGKYLRDVDVYFCPFCNLDPKPVPVPSVFTLVDIQEEFFPEFFSRRALLARKIDYYGSTLMADRTITISDFSRDTIIRIHKRNPSRISRIYLSVDERFYAEGGSSSARGASAFVKGLPEKYIFYPANHWRHKNHRLLLNGLKLLKERYKEDIYLVLTGHKEENGFDLEKECTELSIQDRVISTQYVDIDEMVYLYRHAVCLCFPSFFEGFGLPLVEAMASGCPVVCSNTTCMPEIAGDAALYVDPYNDAQLAENILQIMEDGAERKALIERGKERSRLFSADRMAREHLRVFGEAAEAFSRTRTAVFSFPLFCTAYKGYRFLRSFYGKKRGPQPTG